MQLRAAAQDIDLVKYETLISAGYMSSHKLNMLPSPARQTNSADLDRIRRDHELDIRLIKQDADQRQLDAEHRVATALGELSASNLAKDALEDKLQQQLELNRNLDHKLRHVQYEMADLVKSHAGRVAGLEETLKQVWSDLVGFFLGDKYNMLLIRLS